MTEIISLTIDNIPVSVPSGFTILKAAETVGIQIPTICFHEACTSNALCRICVVEVEGARTLIPACVAQVSEGMIVQTHSDRVQRARRTILEMLSSTVDLTDSPEILAMMNDYHANPERFPESNPRTFDLLDDNPMYVRDYSRCILCWRCVQVCAEDAQYTHAINFSQRGFDTRIDTFYHISLPETTCVFCGQCVAVCPTGALKPKRQWLLETGYSPIEIMSLTRAKRNGNKSRIQPERKLP